MSEGLTLMDRVSDDTARARLERLLYFVIGLAAVVYGAILYPGINGIAGQTPQLEPWYGYGLIVVTIGLPLLLSATAWLAPRRLAHALAGTTAILFVVGMAVFPAFLEAPTLDGNVAPWYQGIHALHGVLAAVAWRHQFVWAYGLAQGIVIGLVQDAVRVGEERAAFLDGVGSLVFVVIIMAATLGILGAADRLDAASEGARAQAARNAASRTREREESRINAIVHDDVMSVLLAASRESPPHALSSQASAALAAIDALETRDATQREYTLDEMDATLQDEVDALAPGTPVTHRGEGDTAVPAEVVTALADALGEALRNSVRHGGYAGEEVPRAVTICATDAGVTVTLADRGRGFNTRQVAQRRLGIRLSIIERMQMVPGGAARIDSVVGEGTTVRLTWERTS